MNRRGAVIILGFIKLRERNDAEGLLHIPEQLGRLQLGAEEESLLSFVDRLIVGRLGVGCAGAELELARHAAAHTVDKFIDDIHKGYTAVDRGGIIRQGKGIGTV